MFCRVSKSKNEPVMMTKKDDLNNKRWHKTNKYMDKLARPHRDVTASDVYIRLHVLEGYAKIGFTRHLAVRSTT